MFFMHVHGHGTATELAQKLKPAIDLIGKSTRGAAPSAAPAAASQNALDTAKLADYGLATPTNGPSTPCHRHGTYDYLAPEVFRGTLADSILSRGISRRQYFLAKLHSRLFSVLVTFLVMTAMVLTVSHFLLHEDLTLNGSIMSLATLGSLMTLIITSGVTVGALTSTTVFGVSVVWLGLYTAGFGLSMLPAGYPAPDRVLAKLPQILRGVYDMQALMRLMGAALGASALVALLGMFGFSRSDV